MYVFMGGTFDPVHEGHIQGALQVSSFLNDNDVHLLPVKAPVHKKRPSTSTLHRLDMLQLALTPYPQLNVDVREITAVNESSYTIKTLKQLREELGESVPIIMVIGMDSFLTLPSWFEAPSFLNYCHIIVLQRPGYIANEESLSDFIQCKTDDKNILQNSPAGNILFLSQSPLDVSATNIRKGVNGALDHLRMHSILPDKVADYIRENKLYI